MQRSFYQICFVRMLIVVLLIGIGDIARTDGQTKQDQPENINAESKPPMSKGERKRTLGAALLAVAGIGIGGAFLVAFVVLWGARLRRRIRQPSSTQSIKDDFWYLRSKPAVTDSSEDEPHESTGDE